MSARAGPDAYAGGETAARGAGTITRTRRQRGVPLAGPIETGVLYKDNQRAVTIVFPSVLTFGSHSPVLDRGSHAPLLDCVSHSPAEVDRARRY